MHTFETLEFYRGMSNQYPIDRPVLVETRKNRVPRDTIPEVHIAADDWFNKRFGVRYRSQSVFLTSRCAVARGYGATPEHAFRVLPLGQYSFCWSPVADDMLKLMYDGVQAKDCPARLEAARYSENDLLEAHDSGHEVMLFCERYVAIPIGLFDLKSNVPEVSKIIIL